MITPRQRDVRPQADQAPASTEESSVEETLSAHLARVLQSRLRSLASAGLDPCIAFLQELRQSVGISEAEGESDNCRPTRARSRPRGEAAAEAEAPKPKRRLFRLLVDIGVLLVGVMAGGALAYGQFEKLLKRETAESVRLQAIIAKQSRSAAANQKELAQTQARLAEAETRLASPSIVMAEKKLEEEHAKRVEAENALEASLAEYARTAAEKQKRLDEVAKILGAMMASERSGKSERPGSRDSASGVNRRPFPLRTANCTLQTSNVADLKDCIAKFNR